MQTHIVPLDFGGLGVRFRDKFDSECLANYFGWPGLKDRRVHGQAIKETAMGVLEFAQTICNLGMHQPP